MSASLRWCSQPTRGLHGALRIPGDKSISHRAIMLAALAEGVSSIDGFLEGEDTRATARAFSRMGVQIEAPSSGAARRARCRPARFDGCGWPHRLRQCRHRHAPVDRTARRTGIRYQS
jgi:5-enolpyruvylshikimate-3-phosphate synthase